METKKIDGFLSFWGDAAGILERSVSKAVTKLERKTDSFRAHRVARRAKTALEIRQTNSLKTLQTFLQESFDLVTKPVEKKVGKGSKTWDKITEVLKKDEKPRPLEGTKLGEFVDDMHRMVRNSVFRVIGKLQNKMKEVVKTLSQPRDLEKAAAKIAAARKKQANTDKFVKVQFFAPKDKGRPNAGRGKIEVSKKEMYSVGRILKKPAQRYELPDRDKSTVSPQRSPPPLQTPLTSKSQIIADRPRPRNQIAPVQLSTQPSVKNTVSPPKDQHLTELERQKQELEDRPPIY